MQILITGGAGFVGRRFARKFLNDGHKVTVVDNLASGQRPHLWAFKCQHRYLPNLTFVEADVRDFMKTQPASDFELIIHCAAIVGGRLKIDGDPLAVATDLSIDAEFMNWCVRSKPMPKVVYFSSSAVYPVELQTRDMHCNLAEILTTFNGSRVSMPDMTYGWAKLSGEYLCKFAAETYGLNVVIYRPFGGYGEDQSFDYPFPSIVRRIVSGENPVTVWGSGDQERDFIHIDDIVNAVCETMHKLKPAEVLNLGTGNGLSFRELAHRIAKVMSKRIDVVNDASKPEGVFSRVADTYKLEQWWKPSIALDIGIRGVIKSLTGLSRSA